MGKMMDKRNTRIEEKDSNSFQKQIQDQGTQTKSPRNQNRDTQIKKLLNEANQLRANYAKLQKDYGYLDTKLHNREEECNEKTAEIKKFKEQIDSLNEVLDIRNDAYDQLYKTWTETTDSNQNLRLELKKQKKDPPCG